MPHATPDLTPAQWSAVLKWIAVQFVAWGWLTSTPSQVALSVLATVLCTAWMGADAWIRGKRSKVAATAIEKGYVPVSEAQVMAQLARLPVGSGTAAPAPPAPTTPFPPDA